MEENSSKPKTILNSVMRWFYTASASQSEPGGSNEVDWIRMIPFMAMHLACLGVLWVGWSSTAVAVAVFLYLFRMFAITGFYHRYFSHRTFKTTRWGQLVFAILGSTATQKGPLWWAAHHRDHHRYSDKEGDIHSPLREGFYWSHVGWITRRANFRTKLENVKDLAKFPELRFLDRFDLLVPLLLAGGLFLVGHAMKVYAPHLNTSGPQLLVWGFFISTVVLFHGTSTINSLAHLVGRRRYQTTDESRNNFILALITLGEGWHNNHHHFPASTRQGFFWWEVDITYYILRVLAWLGIVWDLKGVPEHVRIAERL